MKHSAQRGSTLVEVLVALLVFSFGLLGTVAMQAKAGSVGADSEDRMRAAMLANEVVSMMWARRTMSLPTADLAAWNTRVADISAAGLPSGAGSITSAVTNGITTTTITITWNSPVHWSAGNSKISYVTQVAM